MLRSMRCLGLQPGDLATMTLGPTAVIGVVTGVDERGVAIVWLDDLDRALWQLEWMFPENCEFLCSRGKLTRKGLWP